MSPCAERQSNIRLTCKLSWRDSCANILAGIVTGQFIRLKRLLDHPIYYLYLIYIIA